MTTLCDEVKYVINEDNIVFYYNKEMRIVNKEDLYVYNSLRESLVANNNESLRYVVDTRTAIKDSIINKSELFGLDKRIRKLEDEGLPLEPLLNFVDRLPENMLYDNKLLALVGTTELPLTWTGDIVAYQRASWIPYDRRQPLESWVSEFKPYHRVSSGSNSLLVVGGFNWTQRQCADTGLTFEVIVQPEDIVNSYYSTHQKSTDYGMWCVKEVTQLSILGKIVQNSAKATTGVVEFVNSCSELGDQMVVRLPYNMSTASRMVSAMFSVPEGAKYNKMAVTSVPVSVSC